MTSIFAALQQSPQESEDSGDPVVVGHTYTDPKLLLLDIPAQGTPNAADPYLDINNDAVDYGKDAITLVPAGWSQAGTVLTNAEFAQTNMAEAAAADKSAPEVKDAAPTAASTNSVESQGILSALTALNRVVSLTHDKANQQFIVTDQSAAITNISFAIIDDLLSTDALVPLSANQGRLLRLLVEGIGERVTVADQAAMALDAGPVGQSYYVLDDDGTAAGNWAMYIRTATAPNVDSLTLSKADIVGAFTALTDLQIQDRTDTTVGLVAGGKQLFDERQVNKGVAANFDPTDADYEVGKPWDAKTLVDRFGKPTIVQPGHLGAVVLDTDSHYWADETPGAVPVPSATTVGHEYAITISPANVGETDAVKLAAKGKTSHFRIIELSPGVYGAQETDSSAEHTHKALKNIAVHVHSEGTNASSSVDIELLIDGAWNPTDWVVSTTPVTGLESYTAHGPVHYDKVAITGPIGISHNKDGWLFFEYVGDAAEGELTGVNYTGADGANSDGEIIVNLAGTNQAVTFANKAAVVATDLEFQQAAEATAAKNALVYPVGNFTALPVNDSGTGEDGAVYKLPTVDALQITLPNKADMNAAEGIYRVRVSGDWAALSTQATVLSFIDDTANGVDMGTGLPDDGNEWLDLVFDVASDKWIATSGGDVTLTQVIPTYDEHAEVPANIRLYLASGIGAAAEGLWRKETAGDAPNMIG